MERERLQLIVDEYRDELRKIFQGELHSVILFGSQARMEGREGSDIDILCIINGPVDYERMIKQSSEITAALSLKYGIVLSRVFASLRDVRERQLPFFMNIRREGLAA